MPLALVEIGHRHVDPYEVVAVEQSPDQLGSWVHLRSGAVLVLGLAAEEVVAHLSAAVRMLERSDPPDPRWTEPMETT